MKTQNAETFDLTLPENQNGSLAFIYLKIILLPVLVYIAFFLGFLGVINFKVELHSILMMSILLVIALILARHSAEYGCGLFAENLGNFKSELRDYIVSNLLIIGDRKKSNAKFDAFIDEYGYSLRNQNYASVAAGIFPMLGILGTFISIAISMPEFSSTNINMLEKEIAQLLGGVGTAFYVSIYGIFLALWWIYFEKKGISKFQKTIIKYKNATKNFFWSEAEINQSYLQEILDKNTKILASFESMNGSGFNAKLNGLIEEKISNLNEILDTEKMAATNLQTQIERANELLLSANSSHNNIMNEYNQFIPMLKAISANLVGIQNAISDEYLNLSNLKTAKFGDLDTSFKNLNDELKKYVEILRTHDVSMMQSQKTINANLKQNLDSFLNDFREIFKIEEPKQPNFDVLDELKKTLASIDEKVKIDENK